LLLSLHPDALGVREAAGNDAEVCFLSGPEGGLSPAEEAAARAAGLLPVTLGPRVLRAETAALVAMTALLV
jgi:16S rRNA (uracil1498-N3)-methyltransferase